MDSVSDRKLSGVFSLLGIDLGGAPPFVRRGGMKNKRPESRGLEHADTEQNECLRCDLSAATQPIAKP